MTRIPATGFDDVIPEDRPSIHVSHGAGNRTGDEVHIHFHDPAVGDFIEAWFPRAKLLAALQLPANPKEN